MESNLRNSASWIVVSLETGKPVLETQSWHVVSAINLQKYKVVRVADWLASLSRREAV